jgi:putative ABC transport system permease protein
MPFNIGVITNDPSQLEMAVNEATGLFRTIRKDPLGTDNSFKITRSNEVSKQLIENMGVVTLISTIIAGITLLGAAIGLMNIMLVSVTERTKEIGIRNALGANNQTIRMQFLTEAVLICQIGGVMGILVGITIGNIVAQLIDGTFIIPWLWISVSIILSFGVGVLAGFFPANKAANLDPIESLRYE